MQGRSRSRLKLRKPRTTWIDWTGPGGPGSVGPIEVPATIDFWEEIDDVVGSDRVVKPVLNRRLAVDNIGRPLLHNVQQNNYQESYRNGPPLEYVETDPAFARFIFPSISSTLRHQMADQAFEKLVPQVPQEVSLPNFLYELRDVAALVPKLDASMAKTVSGGYLNYQFGWKPFIGDLKKLGSLLDTVNRRLDYLRKTYGKETRISFTTTFTAVDIGISLFDPKSVGISQTSGGYTEFEGTFRCGAHLYHKLKGLDGLQGVMRGAAGALGLNNPAGVVWEAIPYSFVADWFGNLGEQIQRQAYQPFEGDWDLRNMSHSFRYTFKHETWHGPKAYGADYPDVPYMSYRQSGEHYERGEGLPASGLYLTTTDFGPQQQKLAAALIHQFA